MRKLNLMALCVMTLTAISVGDSAHADQTLCKNKKSGVLNVKSACAKAETKVKTGIDLGAVAYGFVGPNGLADSERSSSNFSSRRLESGIYCVKVKGQIRSKRLPVVTPDFSTTPAALVFPTIISTVNSGCESEEFGILFYQFDSTNKVFTNPAEAAFATIIP